MANHFDLTDLQLIVNIGDASSLTRGAEKSHLSLPAASNRVKNLEEHFGTRLFHRNSQGVTLTPSGDAFLRHARLVLRQIEHLRGDIHEYARGIKGQVRMMANTTAMTEFMPGVLSRYLAAHPDVTVELRERLSYLIVKAVSEGSADIGIVAGRPAASDLEFLPYQEDRLVLVTPENHPLGVLDEVSFADTMSYEYVGLSEWSAIHAFLIQAANSIGHPFRFRVEVSNFETVCRMIELRNVMHKDSTSNSSGLPMNGLSANCMSVFVILINYPVLPENSSICLYRMFLSKWLLLRHRRAKNHERSAESNRIGVEQCRKNQGVFGVVQASWY